MKQFILFFLFFLLKCLPGHSQATDTVPGIVGSLAPQQKIIPADPLIPVLEKNTWLNSRSTPAALAIKKRVPLKENALFYILAGLLFFFGVIKMVYSRYFSTLFRVFFNSSLRQNQLTDQLMQAKLPSLFFNLLFLFSAALYVYFLLQKFSFYSHDFNWQLLVACLLAFLVVYAGKFMVIKFLGWITGFNSEADTYIFVVFLINKIIGICLLPVIIILAFSDPLPVKIISGISFIAIGIMLLLRFTRSYGLLEHKLKVSRFHFLLYVFSFELLPLAIIYKAVELFIMKKL